MASKSDDQKRREASEAANRAKEVITGLAAGKAPDNDIIIASIDAAKSNLAAQAKSSKTPLEGRDILKHSEEVLDAAKEFLEKKNPGGELQDLAEHAAASAKIQAEKIKEKIKDAPPVDKEEVKRQVSNIADLLRLFASDADFRSLLVDLLSYANQLFNERTTQKLKDVAKDDSKGKDIVDKASEMKGILDWESDRAKDEAGVDQKDVEMKLERVLSKLASNPAFRDAAQAIMRELSRMYNFDEWAEEAFKAPDKHAEAAAEAGMKFVHNITGDDSLDKILCDIKSFAKKLKQDPDAGEFVRDLRGLVEHFLDRPESLADEGFRKARVNPIIERGKTVIRRYENAKEIDDIIEKANKLVDSFKNDETLNRLQSSIKKLYGDFVWTDPAGNPHITPTAMEQIRKTIIPLLADQLKFIGIPKVEVHEPHMDAWFDNLAINFYDLLPSCIKIRTNSETVLDLKDVEIDRMVGNLVITLYDLKLNIKDAKFWLDYRATPSFKDEGTFDLITRGANGINISIGYHIHLKKGAVNPVLLEPRVLISNMPSIKLSFHKDAEHHMLLNFMSTFAAPTMRARVQKTIETKFQEIFSSLRTRLNGFLEESAMSKAAKEIRSTVEATKVAVSEASTKRETTTMSM